MTDSSPQFGRNYQVTLLRRIRRIDLPKMLDLSEELYHRWDDLDIESYENGNPEADDEAAMVTIAELVCNHQVPAAACMTQNLF